KKTPGGPPPPPAETADPPGPRQTPVPVPVPAVAVRVSCGKGTGSPNCTRGLPVPLPTTWHSDSNGRHPNLFNTRLNPNPNRPGRERKDQQGGGASTPT